MIGRFVRWFGTLPSVVKILLAFAALFVLGFSVLLTHLTHGLEIVASLATLEKLPGQL